MKLDANTLKTITMYDITTTLPWHPEKVTWAEFIAEWRRLAGLSRAEASRMLGVAPGTLRAWERGTSSPCPEKMRAYIETARTTARSETRGDGTLRPGEPTL